MEMIQQQQQRLREVREQRPHVKMLLTTLQFAMADVLQINN
jgi:hypothetical protein